jgi:type II secretory pathway pseudopilin PulG
MNVFRGQKGQTLVEAIVVIGIVVLLVTGLIAGTTMSLKTARTSKTRTQAVKYSQEAIEVIRSKRDENWNTFIGFNGQYCIDSNGNLESVLSGCSTIVTPDGTYVRTILFTPNIFRMVVLVTVHYPDETENKPIVLTTYFTQWK